MTDPVSTSGPTITSPIVVGGAAPVVESPIVQDNPAPPAADAAGVVTPTPDPATASATDPNKTTPEWAQKRINELTAKRYEAERTAQAEKEARVAAEKANADLLAKMAGGTTPPGTVPATSAPMGEDEIEKRAQAKAVAIAQANEFNKACNNVVEAGKKDFAATWDEAIKNLSLVGAIGQNVSPEFLETAIELKNPAAVLHHLGTNMEEAERIAKLPPKRMALEMARVEAQLSAPPVVAPTPPPAPVSQAPAPVIPVGGAAKPGSVDMADPATNLDDWMQTRSKQIEERRKRYLRH